MRRLRTILILLTCIAGCAAYLTRVKEDFVEVNRMTGAVRSRVRYAYVFNTSWKIEPTWVSESAVRQGIFADNGWKFLAGHSFTPLSIVYSDGHRPASWSVRIVNPETIGLNTSADVDRFVRDFVNAPEQKQSQMLGLNPE